MKRTLLALASSAFLLGALHAQSLADIARQEQAKKPAKSPNARVYTNESLSLKSVSETDTVKPASGAAGATTAASTSDLAKNGKISDPAAAKDEGKQSEEIKTKIAAQKQEITQLQREIDVAQREGKLKAAQFYGDAGARLRDEKNYMEAERKAKADLDAKQQALAQAQQKLAQLEEEARRAGVPANQRQ
jgi:hypothetical protein